MKLVPKGEASLYNKHPSQLKHIMPKVYIKVDEAARLRAALGRPLETDDLFIYPKMGHVQLHDCLVKVDNNFKDKALNLVHIGYYYWMEVYTLRGARKMTRTVRQVNEMLNEGWLRRAWRKVKFKWFGIDKL